MECTFQVGDKVVCVDASDTNGLNRPELEEGRIYTVSEVKPHPTRGWAGVCVAEIVNRWIFMIGADTSKFPTCRTGFEPFHPSRFRIVKRAIAHQKQSTRIKELV